MANNKDFKVKNGIQPTVYHEAVGTVTSATEGYNLTVASFDSVDFSVSSQDSTPIALTFKPDGTKMYVFGNSTSDIFQYSLSTAWDLSTASYESKSYSANAEVSSGPESVVFKSDGTKMFLLGNSGTYGDDVFRYTLSTAWDVSTASYDSNTVDVESQETGTRSIALNSDGTKLFVLGDSSGEVLVWSMSTAYDLSTASYDSSESLDTSSEDNSPKGMSFSSDGTKLFILGNQTDKVHKYNLTTAFDVSTASYSNESFLISSQDTAMRDVALKSDGTKMYTVGFTNDKVYQYSTALNTKTLDLSTGSVFEITPTSDIQINLSNPADSGTVSQATLLLDGQGETYSIEGISAVRESLDLTSLITDGITIELSSDGTKLYVNEESGNATEGIFQFDLAVPYILSSADTSNYEFLDISSRQLYCTGITFKPDGTKMYLGDAVPAPDSGINGTIFQYSLSTAWDVSTATYDNKKLVVNSQASFAGKPWFKSDGTRFFLFEDGDVYQYSLTTAWDISTGSYDNETVSGQRFVGMVVKPDGTRFWIGSTFQQWDLTTAWDLSTATNTGKTSPNGGAQTAANNGAYLYNFDSEIATRKDFSSAYTITYPSTVEWSSGTTPTSPAVSDTDVLTFMTVNGGTSYVGALNIDGAK